MIWAEGERERAVLLQGDQKVPCARARTSFALARCISTDKEHLQS